MTSDAVDAVRSAIPQGFKIYEFNRHNPLNYNLLFLFLKFETLILG